MYEYDLDKIFNKETDKHGLNYKHIDSKHYPVKLTDENVLSEIMKNPPPVS